MKAPPVTPIDPYTRIRFHWIRGNDFEVWEWLRNGSWLRPGHLRPLPAAEAGDLGWAYAKPAPTPNDEAGFEPHVTPSTRYDE